MSGDVPETAITAAEQFMMRRYPKWTPDSKGTGFTWSIFLEALAAAAPWIAAAERETIRQLVTAWLAEAEARLQDTRTYGLEGTGILTRCAERLADLLDGAT